MDEKNKLLKKRKHSEQKDDAVSALFSKPVVKITEEAPIALTEAELNGNELEDGEKGLATKKDRTPLTEEEEKERNERTVFVGNLSLLAKKKDILDLFKKYGKIESLWFRSIPTEHSRRVPKKAAVLSNKINSELKDTKNAYVLFSTKENAMSALACNGTLLHDKHIRVDIESNKDKHDYKTTIFIGNLPYNTNEEELRRFFTTAGKIKNIRVIRHPRTYVGIGIAYVTFESKEEMRNAIAMEKSEFNGRSLRIKKATSENKLQKKEKQREETKEFKKTEKLAKKQKHSNDLAKSFKERNPDKKKKKNFKKTEKNWMKPPKKKVKRIVATE